MDMEHITKSQDSQSKFLVGQNQSITYTYIHEAGYVDSSWST